MTSIKTYIEFVPNLHQFSLEKRTRLLLTPQAQIVMKISAF